MMTMSLRLRVGTRLCSTYVMEPSTTRGAVSPLRRRAATNVIVFQCPCGTRPISRSPRGQRPLSRTILVFAAVSSMNTNRAELSMPCSRIQRRRARATSGRSCSAARRLFFEGDLVSSEKPPERGAAACNPPLAHCGEHLIQRQIRLLRYQGEQPIRVLLQRRSASSARHRRGAPGVAPALQPFDRRTRADLKVFGSLTPRITALADRLAHKPAPGNPSILT